VIVGNIKDGNPRGTLRILALYFEALNRQKFRMPYFTERA
jgi:hypothetical protein